MKTSTNTTLTLRIATRLRDRIRKQAEKENRSMSNLVEVYLKNIFDIEEGEDQIKMTPKLGKALELSQEDIDEERLEDLNLNNLSALFE